mgnify:CR=1 FL=1
MPGGYQILSFLCYLIFYQFTGGNMILYYQPHQQRKSEAFFFEALRHRHPDAEISFSHFEVPIEKMDQFLDVEKIIRWLNTEKRLPIKKRTESLQILRAFPSNQIRIAFSPKEISFDLVIQTEHRTYYWEFQERQHASLTIDRPKKVYTPAGEPVIVPRFFQRLIRDLWRLSFFHPYTLVWKDWFESTARSNDCLEISEGYREFHLPGKFTFKEYMNS